METTNEVSLPEIYAAAQLFQVPGVEVFVGGGSITVRCHVNCRNSLSITDAANLVAHTSLAIGRGLAEMFPSRKMVREKYQGKNVGRSGFWNMGSFCTQSLHSAIKVKLTEEEQNQLILGNRI